MPRSKDDTTNAERQAAYRQRHRNKQPPREDLLAALGRSFGFDNPVWPTLGPVIEAVAEASFLRSRSRSSGWA